MYAKGSEATAAITRSKRGSVIERMPEEAVKPSAVSVAFVIGESLLSSSKARAVPERDDVDDPCGERPRDAGGREQDQGGPPVQLELFEEPGHEHRLERPSHAALTPPCAARRTRRDARGGRTPA